MFYVTRIIGNSVCVADTEDGVEERILISTARKVVSQGVEIKGVSDKSIEVYSNSKSAKLSLKYGSKVLVGESGELLYFSCLPDVTSVVLGDFCSSLQHSSIRCSEIGVKTLVLDSRIKYVSEGFLNACSKDASLLLNLSAVTSVKVLIAVYKAVLKNNLFDCGFVLSDADNFKSIKTAIESGIYDADNFMMNSYQQRIWDKFYADTDLFMLGTVGSRRHGEWNQSEVERFKSLMNQYSHGEYKVRGSLVESYNRVRPAFASPRRLDLLFSQFIHGGLSSACVFAILAYFAD